MKKKVQRENFALCMQGSIRITEKQDICIYFFWCETCLFVTEYIDAELWNISVCWQLCYNYPSNQNVFFLLIYTLFRYFNSIYEYVKRFINWLTFLNQHVFMRFVNNYISLQNQDFFYLFCYGKAGKKKCVSMMEELVIYTVSQKRMTIVI